MLPFRRSRLLRNVCCAALALAAAFSAGPVHAQAPQPSIGSANDITFQLLARSPYSQLYQVDQLRRFHDRQNQLVEVDESLTVDGNGDRTSPFRLQFRGVVGCALNAQQSQKWSNTYQRYGSLFYEYGSFRVHDADLAAQNYRLLTFGTVLRANRCCWRTVVYPRRLDKSVWLLDLDAETAVPLYVAEFDANGRLVSQVQVTRFATSQQVGRLGSNWEWRPRMQITPIGATDDGQLPFTDDVHVVKPTTGTLMPDYRLLRSHIADDPFNGERSLVDTFSDGIDAFFVVQTPGRVDPFASAPSARLPGGKLPADTIAYYDDPSLRVYQFHQHGVGFQIAGRGSLTRLDQLAKRIYVQAYRQQ